MGDAGTDPGREESCVPRAEMSWRDQAATWSSPVRVVLLRTWISFSVSASAVALVFAAIDGDSLLASDDPYIAGALAGGFCALFAFLHTLVKVLGGSLARRRLAYFSPMLGLLAISIAADTAFPSSEGQGIPTFLGVLVAISAAASYPLVGIRMTKTVAACASIPGILFVVGYCIARSAMTSRLGP